MTIALLDARGTFSQTSSTSFPHTVGLAVPAGTLLIVGVTNNGGGTFTIADNSAQAGTANSYTVRTAVVQGTARVQVAYCYLTRALLSTTTITITLSASRFAAAFYCFSGADPTPLDQSATKGVTTSPLSVGPTGVLAASTELAINMVGWFGGATTSGASGTTAGYTLGTPLNSGGVTSRVELVTAYKIGAGTAAETSAMTFTSITSAAGNLLTFKAAGGTIHTQSVSGALGFAGSAPRKASTRKVTGAVSFAGSRTSSPTARLVTASFQPVGALSRTLSLARSIAGALSFTGSQNRSTARTLPAGSFQPVGTRTSIKSVSKAVSGALSFVGSVTRFPTKMLPATLTPTGLLNRALSLNRTLDPATLTPTGAVSKFTSRLLPAAAMKPVGMVITSSRGALTAAFRPVGVVSNGLPARTMFAALSFTGGVTKNTTRLLVSSLIAAGALRTLYIPATPPGIPGGGGLGALMGRSHFERYQVAGNWRGVKRVKFK